MTRWFLVLLAALVLAGCGLPDKRGVAWSWPDNLSELESYWYEFNPEAPVDSPWECGRGAVARYCPEAGRVPAELQARLQARRILYEVGGLGGAADLVSLRLRGDTAWFLSSDDSLYALDVSSGKVRWAVEAPLGYDCRGEPVPAAGAIVLTCRHNLGRDHSIFAFSPQSGTLAGSALLEAAPAAVFPAGDQAGIALSDGSLWRWNPAGEGPALAGEVPDKFRSIFEALAGHVREGSPALAADGVVYLGGAAHVWALDAGTLEERWRGALPGRSRAIILRDEGIVVLSENAQALLLEPETGERRAGLDAEDMDVSWYLATVGKSLSWELTVLDEAYEPQIVFCELRGLCLGIAPDLSETRWSARLGERLRRNRPWVVGTELWIEAPDGTIIVTPGLPLESVRNPAK